MINRLWAVHLVKLSAVVVTLVSTIIALSGCDNTPILLPSNPTALESGNIIVFNRSQLWLIDPSTTNLTPYMHLDEEEDSRIISVKISPDSRFIYTIVGPLGNLGDTETQLSQLIQIDAESLEVHQSFSYMGLLSPSISPNGQRIVLRYYTGYRYFPGFCVLDVSQGRCEHGDFSVSHIHWIDNRRFVTEDGGNVGLVVVDAETLEARPLQVTSATSFDHIPGTQQVLFAQADRGAMSFFTIDVNTLQTSRQPYMAEIDRINALRVSPDGRYLLYGRWTEETVLVEFASGEIIAEINSVCAAKWLSDSRGLVLLRCSQEDARTVELFDLETQQNEVFHTFDWPVGVVAVP